MRDLNIRKAPPIPLGGYITKSFRNSNYIERQVLHGVPAVPISSIVSCQI